MSSQEMIWFQNSPTLRKQSWEMDFEEPEPLDIFRNDSIEIQMRSLNQPCQEENIFDLDKWNRNQDPESLNRSWSRDSINDTFPGDPYMKTVQEKSSEIKKENFKDKLCDQQKLNFIHSNDQNIEESTYPVKTTSVQAVPVNADSSPLIIPFNLDDKNNVRTSKATFNLDLDYLPVPNQNTLDKLSNMLKFLHGVTHKFYKDDVKALYECISSRLSLCIFLDVSKEVAIQMTEDAFLELLKRRVIKMRVDKFQYQMKFYSRWSSSIYKGKKGKKDLKKDVLKKVQDLLGLNDSSFKLIFGKARSNGMHKNAVLAILVSPKVKEIMLNWDYTSKILEELNNQTVDDIQTNFIKRLCANPKLFVTQLESSKLSKDDKDQENQEDNEAMMEEELDDENNEGQKTKKDKVKLPFSCYENLQAALEFLEKLHYRGDKKEKGTKETSKVISDSLEIIGDMIQRFKERLNRLQKAQPELI